MIPEKDLSLPAYIRRRRIELGRIIVGHECMWIAYQERYRAYIPNPAHVTY